MLHSNQNKPAVDDSSAVCPDNAGFTLLEVTVSIALMGLLAAIFGMGLVAAVQSHEFSRTNVDLTQKSQLAMTRIQRELMELIRVSEVTDDQTTAHINRFMIYERMVSGNNQSTVRFGLHYNPGDNSIYLYTNLNSTVTQLDGTTLAQGDVLIDGVENLTFECFKGQGGIATAWDESTDEQSLLSTIRVTLDLERRDNPETSQRFQTVIHMRNNGNAGGVHPDTVPQTRNEYGCFIGAVANMAAWRQLEVNQPDRKRIR